ncbi:MAG: Gp37 family protein [Rhodoblastus sp.]
MSYLPDQLAPAVAASIEAAATAPPLEWPGRFVQAMVAILNAEAPGSFMIDEMPDKPGEVDISNRDGAIIVHYRGSKYAVSPSADPVRQQRTFDVDVHVVARGLKGRTGAPNAMELVRKMFQARRVEGAGPLSVVADGFHAEDGGIWDYVISFRGQLPAVGGHWPRHGERP